MRTKLRKTRGGSTKNGNVYMFRDMGSFETIFVDEENQVALHNAQPTRNLPNILRSSNARAYKNYKTFMLDKHDVSFVPHAEDANASSDLNAALSSYSERDGKYNKVASPKSHHQRKQVHHPLDARYDVPSWNNNNNNNNNNNKDEDEVDELETLYVSLGHEEGTLTKINNEHADEERRFLFKKSTRVATGKSDDNETAKLSSFSTSSTFITADANTADDVATQSDAHNFLGDDVSTFDIVKTEIKSDEWPTIFYRDNDIYDLERKDNATCNSIISGKPTERDALQKDPSYEFAAGGNGSEENSMSKNNRSNFLLASEVLCTCACANCTISEQDYMLYEDSLPSYANSDAETQLYAPYAYDFYTSDYYHVLGDMDGFDEMFSYEVTENTSVTRENACNNNDSNCGAAKLIETNVPAPNSSTTVKLCEVKNSSIDSTDRAQDSYVESSPVELMFDEPIGVLEPTEQIGDFDEASYLNLDDFLVETNKTTSQNQDSETSAFTDVPVPVRNKRQRKKDVCVIQCAQCNRLFSKNKFRKHFTHCSFYKENFKCHICNKIYRYKSSLVHHLKLMHDIANSVYDKYYICNKCEKPYVRFRAFQRHLLIHDK